MSRQRTNRYPFESFEPVWQERWEAARIFQADRDESRPKWHIADLPPFANGRLHMGHVRNYTLSDTIARFRRMAGYNVLYTSSWDSFGLPNENAAREARCHPQPLAEKYISIMAPQFVRLGLGHDRRRIVAAHDPRFYQWVQWVFLKLVHTGLAFRKKGKVNWCNPCGTALADSLVDGGCCWRCGKPVESRATEQWFVREEGLADSMLEGFATLEGWPDTVKQIQIDWIGRREGVEARFALLEMEGQSVTAFLEEPALLFGVSFVGLGLGHPVLESLRQGNCLRPEVRQALDDLDRRTLATREARDRSFTTSEGIALGLSVRHPLTGAALPLVALESLDLRDSSVAGCPGHVRNDRRLAEELGLPHPIVLRAPEGTAPRADPADFDSRWMLSAQGPFEGMTVEQARRPITEALAARGLGGPAVRYRLRDWSIARQRYWGTPIPIIHCKSCGVVPVPESELPVLLPQDVVLDTPGNPLELHEGFHSAPCPRCGGPGRRETDTFEAYCSPWWYHWHCRTLTNEYPFDPADTRYWMPVDLLIGGIDQSRTCFFHTRMIARVLKQLGYVLHDEPVRELLAIGMVKMDGRKMSKSAGNIVDPEALMASYGVDALRIGVLGAAAPASDLNWSDQSVTQAHNFLSELWEFVHQRRESIRLDQLPPQVTLELDPRTPLRRRLANWLQTGAQRITANLVRHDVHLAVKNLLFLFERLVQFDREARARTGTLSPEDATALATGISALIRMVAPLAPHITEELWQLCGGRGFVATSPWPAPLPDKAEAHEEPAGPSDRSTRRVASAR